MRSPLASGCEVLGPLLLWTLASSPALHVSGLRGASGASGAKPEATALHCSGPNGPAQSAFVTQTSVISCQTLPLVASSQEAGFLTPAPVFLQASGSRCRRREVWQRAAVGEERKQSAGPPGSKQLCEGCCSTRLLLALHHLPVK